MSYLHAFFVEKYSFGIFAFLKVLRFLALPIIILLCLLVHEREKDLNSTTSHQLFLYLILQMCTCYRVLWLFLTESISLNGLARNGCIDCHFPRGDKPSDVHLLWHLQLQRLGFPINKIKLMRMHRSEFSCLCFAVDAQAQK